MIPQFALAGVVIDSGTNELAYDPELPPAAGDPTPPSPPLAGAQFLSLSQLPQLTSNPTANHKLYLNFTGATIASWGSYAPGTTPAYDQDGDPTTFSSGELDSMQQIWARVAEKYSAFNIDVTTINPGSQHFVANDSVQVVIGGNGSWYGPAGGVAYTNSYVSGYGSNTAFVFPYYLVNGTPKYVGEAASHEPGHLFGLNHQSTYSGRVKTAEYSFGNYPGTGPGAGAGYSSPTMGNSYYADRGMWWKGQSSQGSTVIQDDMSVLGSKNFGYRLALSNTSISTAAAATVVQGNLSGSGIIRTMSDQNFYSFSTPGGPATINMNAARYINSSGSAITIGNLDSKLELFSSSGSLVATAATRASNAAPSLDETLSLNLDPGTYYLAAESQGNYGDIGQYTLGGSLYTPLPPAIAFQATNGATIITGGTGNLGATVFNSGGPFANDLNYTFSAGVFSGSATLGAPSPSSGSLSAGASQAHAVAVTSNVLGMHTIGFTAADPNASNNAQSVTATLTVLDHAAPSLTLSGGDHQTVIVGAAGISAGLSLANGSAGQTSLAALDVNAIGPGVAGPTGGKLVASGSQQSYTAALNTSNLGTHTQNFTVTAGDDHTLPGAAAAMDATAAATVTVMDHANASLAADSNQTVQTIDFGNLLRGAPAPSQSFSIYNRAANTTAAWTANLKLTGYTATGDGALSANLSAFRNLAAGDGRSYTATIDTSQITTTGEKTFSLDATQLLDANELPGAGSNNNGTLSVVLKGTVGAAVADNSNSRSTFGPALTALVAQGSSYAGLQSQTAAGSTLDGTTATILAGNASGATTVSMAWRTPALGDAGAASDRSVSYVVDLAGLAAIDDQTHDGSIHTDTFVLQMSYDPEQVAVRTGLSEGQAALSGAINLSYLDLGPDAIAGTADDSWQLAVAGNFGIGDTRFVGVLPWEPGMGLGDYGVDTLTHTAWAVLDHTSQFGVVPEPSSLVLLAAGAIAIWIRRSRC